MPIDFSKIPVPYGICDSGINPLNLLFELYRQSVCTMRDKRRYAPAILAFLREHGTLVSSALIAGAKKRFELLDEDEGPWADANDDDNWLYLYRDNLVLAYVKEDRNVEVTIHYPVDKPCVHDEFKEWAVETKGESRVSILITRHGNLVASPISFAPPVLDLALNYGTDFVKTHETIVTKLNKRKAGLFLFHGKPGSGKSFYIKYLSSIIEREFIFIPVGMASQLSSPDFISLLTKKREAILILEDAEQAVQQRGTGADDSTVATLLNLSDGILGSILDITIIVTYNAARQDIDKALLRKGRLSFDYDFGPLKVDDARRLATHLGKTLTISEPTTLADIYGAEDNTNYQAPVERRMGFLG